LLQESKQINKLSSFRYFVAGKQTDQDGVFKREVTWKFAYLKMSFFFFYIHAILTTDFMESFLIGPYFLLSHPKESFRITDLEDQSLPDIFY
jgi:hypothetical protein